MKIAKVTWNIRCAAIALAAVALSGCASVPDVVPDEEILHISGNMYETLDVDYRGIFGSEESLKNNAIARADKFAKSRGKVASPVSARAHRVGILADWAWFYYRFELVEPGTPEAYRNITDINIIRDPRIAPEFFAERRMDQPPGEGADDLSAQIRKLDQLRKDGLLTDAEFEAQKKRLLEAQH